MGDGKKGATSEGAKMRRALAIYAFEREMLRALSEARNALARHTPHHCRMSGAPQR
jgi:hypothetical protein